MTKGLWFDHSTNGKLSILEGSESLKNIYEGINQKTKMDYPHVHLTFDEEKMMRSFYHVNIREICGTLEYSLMVEYDAHYFLHKYFLCHGILHYDAKHVM